MKQISSYRKGSMLKILSGLNIIIITAINVALPIFIVIIGYHIARIQLRFNSEVDPGVYQFRITLLCFMLNTVLLTVLNIVFVVNPVLNIESIADEYGHLTDMSTNDTHLTTSSLENMFLGMLNEQKQTIKRQYQAEILRQETELLALQSQINPHFLYNTLDCIRGLALINDVAEIADMTEALSNLFRNMIAKEGQMITLREEFENIKNYIIIQQFRFPNKFKFCQEVKESLMDKFLVPNLTLQPIVENAIMHGLEKKRGNGEIRIKAYYTKKRLVLSVRDNGIGIHPEQLQELNHQLNGGRNKSLDRDFSRHAGIALININQRIKLQFGEEYGLTIMSTPDIYTNVEVIFPVITAEDNRRKEAVYEG